ncbi:MAG: UDP-glucose 4-epimerase GalE [Proteobacteria bacterium]|nr:UDP-glucose 4-epimerase GalE [Pseudomonadota bacterium]
MKLLVTGGAGYVGSHSVRTLLDEGHDVVVLDNLSTGHKWALQDCELISVDLRDETNLLRSIKNRGFDGVLHFAAKSLVGKSKNQPALYYQNNVGGTTNLVRAMQAADIQRLVFSSTAAIFGNPVSDLIDEKHPKTPINVYGQTKLVVEHLLQAVAESSDFSATCLRYFNAAGANNAANLGEWHEPETHLIPNALRAAAGTGNALTLFGDDYPTTDGTCVRDYIHVDDLASAHVAAIEKMSAGGNFNVYNLGNGNGYSVKEVIAACEKAVGTEIPFTIGPRREGDPATLVASAQKARDELDWNPQFGAIDEIAQSAWNWECYRRDTLA